MLRFRPPHAALPAVLLLAASIPGGGAAQVTDTLPDSVAYRLGTIEASVARSRLPLARIPVAVSVVREGQIRHARAQVDLHESLRGVPGVAVDNRHNFALGTRVAIRGFGARSAFGVRGVRILVDGIPVTLPDGQSTLTNVDPGATGRIEVLRGPASVLYGNAAGGVIALHTVEPPAAGLREARIAVGVDEAAVDPSLVRVQATAGDAAERSSWVVSLSHLSIDGFREHSSASRTGAVGRIRWAPDDRSVLTFVLNGAVVPVAENPGSLTLTTALDSPRLAYPNNVATSSGEAAGQLQGGVSYRRGLRHVDVEATAYAHYRDLDNPLPFGRHIDLGRVAGGFRALASTAADAAISVTAGLETEAQRDDRVERDNVDGEPGGATHRDQIDQVLSAAPFVLAQAAVGPGVELRAGARYDVVRFETDDRLTAGDDVSGSRTLDALSGSGGVLVALPRDVSGWASLSTWFQTPTTTELLNAPPAPGEVCCPAGFNPDLEPQDGWGGEVGLRRAGALSWEVVAFRIRVENEILPIQVADGGERDFFRNVGSSVRNGIEAAVATDIGPIGRLAAAYTYSDFRFRDNPDDALEGNRIPGIAPHRLNLALERELGPWRAAVEGEHIARYPVDDANENWNPGFTVVDLRASYELRTPTLHLQPFIALNNVLDERYNSSVVINAFGGRYYEPAPGRTLLLGATARFP